MSGSSPENGGGQILMIQYPTTGHIVIDMQNLEKVHTAYPDKTTSCAVKIHMNRILQMS